MRRCASCPSRYVAYELTFRALDPPTGVRVALYCRRCWHVFLAVLERMEQEADQAAGTAAAIQGAHEMAATEVVLPAPTRIGNMPGIRQQVHAPKGGRNT